MGKLKEYWAEHSPYTKRVMDFLKKWHYSEYTYLQHKETFTLWRPGDFGIPDLIGVCIYTRPAGPTASKSYWPNAPDRVLELRRLCLIDDTPKNAESYFIAHTIRWLKKNTEWEYIISYADGEQGHTGVIYRASNFNYLGKTGAGRTLEVDGKRFHIRTLSMMDRPYGREINKRYNEGDNNVKIIETLPKHIYTYQLKNTKN